MGNLQASEMASAAFAAGLVSLQQAVSWHLTANHFPPIPEYTDLLVDVIVRVRDGELDLEDTVTLVSGYKMLPSRAVWNTDDERWEISAGDLLGATHAWSFIEEN